MGHIAGQTTAPEMDLSIHDAHAHDLDRIDSSIAVHIPEQAVESAISLEPTVAVEVELELVVAVAGRVLRFPPAPDGPKSSSRT